MRDETKEIFFQSQSSLSRNCGIHALNNLLGNQAFTKKNIDAICLSLSSEFINPYKSLFGGDYDVTALIKALNQKNFDVRWLKKNEDVSPIFYQHNFVGFLLNCDLKKSFKLSKLLGSGRHWTCLRKIKGKYAHLDSLEDGPKIFEEQTQVQGLLQILRENGDTILVVEGRRLGTD